MKHLIIFLALLTTAFQLKAQVPEKMSYQSVIRDASNALITNKTVGMQISILQGSPGGAEVYVETQDPVTNLNGLVSIEIGGGTALIGNIAFVNWADGPYYIKTETDPEGGTNYTITGVSQLLSVPYALHAKTADSLMSSNDHSHYIGEEFGGGIIYHLWKDDQGAEHGLIVDKVNLSTGFLWSNVLTTLIGTSAQSSWDGMSNCTAIMAQPGHTSSSAALCFNSANGGQSDWYLPSLDELSILWHRRFDINRILSGIGGATILPVSGNFWSSTESGMGFAWIFNFEIGQADASHPKYSYFFVRSIRRF